MGSIWIIGASSGIGKSLALSYASLGYEVVISARSQQKLVELRNDFNDQKSRSKISSEIGAGSMVVLPLDITDSSSINEAVSKLYQSSNSATVEKVIINAGTCEYVDDLPIDTELFKRIFDTNLFGVINCVNAALPLLESNTTDSSKQLVFVSSSVTYQSLPRAHAYGGSKAALRYLAECLKVDLLDSSIDVRIVSPGFVKTPLTDKNDFEMPFLISSEEAAQRIIKGLKGSSFDIQFPKRFTLILKLFSLMPDALKFKCLSKMTKPKSAPEQV